MAAALGWRAWVRALLSGRKFNRSVDRYNRAAGELDKAVREVLAK